MTKCIHCGQEYEKESDYINDCKPLPDGWTWDYVHKCQLSQD